MLKRVGRIHRNLIIGIVERGIVVNYLVFLVHETLAYLLVAIVVHKISENRGMDPIHKELRAICERGHIPLGKQRKQQQN